MKLCEEQSLLIPSSSSSSSSSSTWKPTIIVSPIISNQSNNPQSSSIYHLTQEQQWRRLLQEFQQNILNYSLSPSLNRFIPELNGASVKLNSSNISTMISYHALLGRNNSLSILLNNNSNDNISLKFQGFNYQNNVEKTQKGTEFSIDFHGVDVRNAIQFIHSLLEETNQQKYDYKKTILHLVIGKGLHSKNGITRLKPAIQKYLTRYNYRMSSQNEGEICIFL